MNKYSDFDNRVAGHYYLVNFNGNMPYQKLHKKCDLKDLRQRGWLKRRGFMRRVYLICWDARYGMKKGDMDD